MAGPRPEALLISDHLKWLMFSGAAVFNDEWELPGCSFSVSQTEFLYYRRLYTSESPAPSCGEGSGLTSLYSYPPLNRLGEDLGVNAAVQRMARSTMVSGCSIHV